MPDFSQDGITIYDGDCLEVLSRLPDGSVNCCVTSPPYWGLRDYGAEGQLGLEATPEEYVSKMVQVFRVVRRVLRDDGTLWLNLGDSYAGSGKCSGRTWADGNIPKMSQKQHTNAGSLAVGKTPTIDGVKPKDLVGIPWMVAFALRADGWYLRSDIIWHKPNPMPESIKDRPTKAHEYLFLLTKSQRYHYDWGAIAEASVESNDARPRMGQGPNTKYNQKREAMVQPNGKHARTDPQAAGRRLVENVKRARAEGAPHDSPFGDKKNKRTVWTIPTEPYPEAHFATFPTKLIEPCILAGCPAGGTVLDPFTGSGTTALVARKNGCKFVGCEVNPEYIALAARRLRQRTFCFED